MINIWRLGVLLIGSLQMAFGLYVFLYPEQSCIGIPYYFIGACSLFVGIQTVRRKRSAQILNTVIFPIIIIFGFIMVYAVEFFGRNARIAFIEPLILAVLNIYFFTRGNTKKIFTSEQPVDIVRKSSQLLSALKIIAWLEIIVGVLAALMAVFFVLMDVWGIVTKQPTGIGWGFIFGFGLIVPAAFFLIAGILLKKNYLAGKILTVVVGILLVTALIGRVKQRRTDIAEDSLRESVMNKVKQAVVTIPNVKSVDVSGLGGRYGELEVECSRDIIYDDIRSSEVFSRVDAVIKHLMSSEKKFAFYRPYRITLSTKHGNESYYDRQKCYDIRDWEYLDNKNGGIIFTHHTIGKPHNTCCDEYLIGSRRIRPEGCVRPGEVSK